jgi:hypothetical protein
MLDLYHCASCGCMSTMIREFKRFKRVLVCNDCLSDYGKNSDVTRRVDEASEAKVSENITVNNKVKE